MGLQHRIGRNHQREVRVTICEDRRSLQRRPPEDVAWWCELARDFPGSRVHLRDGHRRFRARPVETFTSSLGIQYVGTVNNRWRLYKDPLFPTNQILMGYKGDSYMDSGYFYCPYVPLTQTPVVLDPESFCPRKGILTRYGKKLLREGSKFYARMSIANFVI